MSKNPCPLCHSVKTNYFTNAMNRDYFLCTHCKLIFVPKVFLLDKKEEKKRYDLHKNSINDKGYVNFLSEIVQAISQKIAPPSFGLDYGSGPTPVLAEILRNKGYNINIFDPFYAVDKTVLEKTYDFICMSEVAEHFYNPSQEFEELVKLLKPNAYLFIMTLSTDAINDFPNWHYQKDDTHVCFYSSESMQYIADKYHLILEKVTERLFIFQKTS